MQAKPHNIFRLPMRGMVVLSVLAVAGAAAAAELVVSGNGESAEPKYTEKYGVKPLTPYRVSFEAKKESTNTTGRTICAGLSGRNVDLDLKEDWTSYSDIVATPSGGETPMEMAIRFSLWQSASIPPALRWRGITIFRMRFSPPIIQPAA